MKKEILITVKAYPNPSKKYGETVCCAGVDLGTLNWIRLYPIPFRDLDNNKKFRKYSIIQARCNKREDDKRPESFRVDIDSITVKDWLDTKEEWRKRKSVVLKLPIISFCEVLKLAPEDDASLGLIRPEQVEFSWTKQQVSDQKSEDSKFIQLSFFNKEKNEREMIPFKFHYHFYCSGIERCPGHKLPIVDWEIGQSYRAWRAKYDQNILLEKIKEKWVKISDTNKRDVYFYVGNMKRFRDKFMVLGVFYPPLQIK